MVGVLSLVVKKKSCLLAIERKMEKQKDKKEEKNSYVKYFTLHCLG